MTRKKTRKRGKKKQPAPQEEYEKEQEGERSGKMRIEIEQVDKPEKSKSKRKTLKQMHLEVINQDNSGRDERKMSIMDQLLVEKSLQRLRLGSIEQHTNKHY